MFKNTHEHSTLVQKKGFKLYLLLKFSYVTLTFGAFVFKWIIGG